MDSDVSLLCCYWTTAPASHRLSITWLRSACNLRLPERHQENMEYYILERIHQAIKNKAQANKVWKHSTIQIRDLVILSTHHLVLKAVTEKLKPRFVGPFWVEEQLGANAFKPTLPTTMFVHPVFNVSLLSSYQGKYKPPGPIEVEGEV